VKIFQKYYVRRLYRATSLDDITKILLPWAKDVARPDSPFMLQVSGHLLKSVGGVLAPHILKRLMAHEICRVMFRKDLEASIMLSLIETYRRHDMTKGVDIVNWLSWITPYECSKLVYWRDIHPSDWQDTPELDIESTIDSSVSVRIQLLCDILGLSKQLRYYYRRKFS